MAYRTLQECPNCLTTVRIVGSGFIQPSPFSTGANGRVSEAPWLTCRTCGECWQVVSDDVVHDMSDVVKWVNDGRQPPPQEKQP
jgi:hypothetical protein